MELEILEHNKATGKAKLKFSHNGVVHTQDFDLIMVVPGTLHLLRKENKPFTDEMQAKVIERLRVQIEREINDGILTNAP